MTWKSGSEESSEYSWYSFIFNYFAYIRNYIRNRKSKKDRHHNIFETFLLTN